VTIDRAMNLRRRQLPPPRLMTSRERRWLNPNTGPLKLLERNLDILVSPVPVPASRAHLEPL
jgi:hypothetical protein